MRNLLIFVSLLMLSILSVGIMPVEAKAPALNVSALDTEALDAYINGQMSKHGIPGISLAVTSGTEIIYLKGYGTAGEGRLMIVGSVPDYVQGVLKLIWVVTGKTYVGQSSTRLEQTIHFRQI